MSLNTISYSLLFLTLCLFAQISLQATPPFPAAVTTQMASRTTRYRHYLWHNIRDNWNFFSDSAKSQLNALGWNCPRPSRDIDQYGNLVLLTENNSGEDFLYMHQQMINMVNKIIADTNDPYGPVVGWPSVPLPTDKTYPVPATYSIPGSSSTSSAINSMKTTSFYTNYIKPQEDYFKDPSNLIGMTLGELGSMMEVTIHNWMHLRFSAKSSYGYRSSSSGAIPKIDPKWDNAQYIWLGDTYSSHVNPIFWKLHGWVNDRIEDWKRANNVATINWIGTWTGGPIENVAVAQNSKSTATVGMRVTGASISRGSASSGDNVSVLDKVIGILAKEKVKESSFADVVRTNWSWESKKKGKGK